MPIMSASEAASPTAMEAMLTVMQSVVTFAMSIFSTITSNPILCFILAGSLVGIGVHVFKLLKGAAR